MGGKISSLLNYSFSPFSFYLVLKRSQFTCFMILPKHICQSSSEHWFSVNKRKFFLNLFPFKNSDLALGETQLPSSKKVSWRKGFRSSQKTTLNGDFFLFDLRLTGLRPSQTWDFILKMALYVMNTNNWNCYNRLYPGSLTPTKYCLKLLPI